MSHSHNEHNVLKWAPKITTTCHAWWTGYSKTC